MLQFPLTACRVVNCSREEDDEADDDEEKVLWEDCQLWMKKSSSVEAAVFDTALKLLMQPSPPPKHFVNLVCVWNWQPTKKLNQEKVLESTRKYQKKTFSCRDHCSKKGRQKDKIGPM